MIRRPVRRQGLSLLMTGLTVMSFNFKAQADENDNQTDLSQVIGGTAVAAASVTTLSWTLLKMKAIHAQASLAELAKESDSSGLKIGSRDLQDITRKIKSGDEVHISYMSSEAEQRRIEMAQTKMQHDQLLRRQHQLQVQLHAASGDQALILANEVRDLAKMVDMSEHRLHELEAQTVKSTPKQVVRIFDMSEARPLDVEEFLLEKMKSGRRIIKIERVDQQKRSSFRNMRIAMGGQLILATLSGLMVMEEILESKTDSQEHIKGSSLYTPILHSPSF